MGLKVELNSMLRLTASDKLPDRLKIGQAYTIKRENIRLYLLDIPILLLQEDWTVQGYCKVTETVTNSQEMRITFELLSEFAGPEKTIYTEHLVSALKKTGYL